MIEINKLNMFGLKDSIYGMRLPMRSHDKMDTISDDIIGKEDLKLCQKLINAGSEHRKFLRQIHVTMNIIAPQYFWKEFDTYRIATTSNSTSQMHMIMKRHLTTEDFSLENCNKSIDTCITMQIISYCNMLIDSWKINKSEDTFRKLIQILPQSFNYERTITCNMEVLYNMTKQRKGHKLLEWREFCDIISNNSLYSQLFKGDQS